jgi:hypothetical protein
LPHRAQLVGHDGLPTSTFLAAAVGYAGYGIETGHRALARESTRRSR